MAKTRQRWVEERSLEDKPCPGGKLKLDGKQEAFLVALACSDAPDGYEIGRCNCWPTNWWNCTSLMSQFQTRRCAYGSKKDVKPWLKEQWCIPTVSSEYVAAMEDVLDVYALPLDPNCPQVCFDERPVQLIGDVYEPLPAQPGQARRYDYEYERHGTANLFVMCQPLTGWREVKVTDQRTKIDFAHCMKDLVDVHFPDANLIRIVLDNLNTHTPGALYEASEPQEARRILRKLDFHYTPKHGSWLNMAEIELAILSRQCLKQRVGTSDHLLYVIQQGTQRRNAQKALIHWEFDMTKARTKLKHLYP